MHTKKTNNTNKLPFCPNKNSKITKLKKKKKNFLYRPVLLEIGQYGQYEASTPVFFPVRNRGVERTGLLAGTVYSGRTGRYGTESITLVLYQKIKRFLLCVALLVLGLLRLGYLADVNALTGYPNIQ